MIGRERFAGRKPNVPPPAPKPPATPAAPEPAPKPSPKRGTPPVVRTEIVIAKCGHEVPFGHFPDKQDKFRDQRRLKVINQECPNCRKTAHEARTRAEQKAAKEKRDGQRGKVGRLPDRSLYIAEYDAQQVLWKGLLLIPQGDLPSLFGMDGPVLFTLMEKLDRAYRKWDKQDADEGSVKKEHEKSSFSEVELRVLFWLSERLPKLVAEVERLRNQPPEKTT